VRSVHDSEVVACDAAHAHMRPALACSMIVMVVVMTTMMVMMTTVAAAAVLVTPRCSACPHASRPRVHHDRDGGGDDDDDGDDDDGGGGGGARDAAMQRMPACVSPSRAS